MTIEPIQDDEEQRFRTMTELIHGTEEQRSAFDFACKAITWRSHLYQWCSIAWRAAGLFPENMFRVLHQLPEPSPTLLITPSPKRSYLQIQSHLFSPNLLSILHTNNQDFLFDLTFSNVHQQCKNHGCQVSGIVERLRTEVTILQKELIEIKAVYGHRKERASGNRVILKGKTGVSTEEVPKALVEAEHATKKKRKTKPESARDKDWRVRRTLGTKNTILLRLHDHPGLGRWRDWIAFRLRCRSMLLHLGPKFQGCRWRTQPYSRRSNCNVKAKSMTPFSRNGPNLPTARLLMKQSAVDMQCFSHSKSKMHEGFVLNGSTATSPPEYRKFPKAAPVPVCIYFTVTNLLIPLPILSHKSKKAYVQNPVFPKL